jgi:outer membrane lipoprotein-sorting protein
VRISAGCLIALALIVPLAAGGQTQITSAEVLQRVSREVTPEVRFREVRTTKLLKTPLVSEGKLRYAPPDRLERETLQPVRETVVIEGMQVAIERDGSQTVMSLVSGTPPAAMIQTLRAVLSGNLPELESLYRASALGSTERWTLHLEPRSGETPVREVRLYGKGGMVDQIEVLERGGDKTVTTLSR